MTTETTTESTPATISVDVARELAGDLIRQLAYRVGDERALDSAFRHWLDVLDLPDFWLVCAAALRTVFRDCLTPTTRADWPPDGIAFNQEEDR